MKCIFMVLSQVKCYERFNLKKKSFQCTQWSIVQFMAKIHFNGPFIIPQARFFCYLYRIHI